MKGFGKDWGVLAIGLFFAVMIILIAAFFLGQKASWIRKQGTQEARLAKSLENEKQKQDMRTPVRLALIADIHAGGSAKRLNQEGRMIQPNLALIKLDKVLKRIKQENFDGVIDLGDNITTREDKEYYKYLKEVFDQYDLNYIFVLGNHDRESVYGEYLWDEFYYARDIKDVRIIVLNTNNPNDYHGDLPKKQLEWLQEQLETDKQVVIAMHHPVKEKQDRGDFVDWFWDFKNIIGRRKNVKFVLSGHYHFSFEFEYEGVIYKTVGPLTLEDFEGFEEIDI
ncbi:MAG: metallophosphoesterase [Patescibacteria group bacterium]|nr:metallophosphoesterase [Patescibacteria group bacterium]